MFRYCLFFLILSAMLPAALFAQVTVLNTGPAAGHWLEVNGKPVLLIGDSVTQGWMESGLNFDQESYVNALAERGIRCLMIWSFIGPSTNGSDERLGYDAPDQSPWIKLSDKPLQWNLSSWNPVYWERLNDLARLCQERNIVLLITVFDGWTKGRFATHPFNQANGGPLRVNSDFVNLDSPEQEILDQPYNNTWPAARKNQWYQERFAQKMIQELSGFTNVVYELFNEGEWYDPAKRAIHEQHFARFFKSRGTLVVSNIDHIANFDGRRDEDIDVLSYHHPRWDDFPGASTFFNFYQLNFSKTPVKPIFFTEPVPSFTGGQRAIDTMTRMLWGSVLGGACGAVVQNDLSFGFDPHATVAAQASGRDAMLEREGICSRFWNNYNIPWWSMRPSKDISSSQMAAILDENEYVIYAQDTLDITVDLSNTPTELFTVSLLDPFTDETSDHGTLPGGGKSQLTFPKRGDWVVHLKIATSNVPNTMQRD